jgi:hypothetical protein
VRHGGRERCWNSSARRAWVIACTPYTNTGFDADCDIMADISTISFTVAITLAVPYPGTDLHARSEAD